MRRKCFNSSGYETILRSRSNSKNQPEKEDFSRAGITSTLERKFSENLKNHWKFCLLSTTKIEMLCFWSIMEESKTSDHRGRFAGRMNIRRFFSSDRHGGAAESLESNFSQRVEITKFTSSGKSIKILKTDEKIRLQNSFVKVFIKHPSETITL